VTTPKLIRIGETCQVGDGTHSKIPRQESGVRYLTSRNFKDGGLDLSQVYYISEEVFAKHFLGNGKALTKPEHGDLVFSIIGTIGEPYLVRQGDRFGLSSSVAIVRPDRTVIDPEFLFYWFKGPAFQNALFGIKGGVAQGYVSLEMIRSLPVPTIPLRLQRRIAGVLSAYDELIENNQRRIRILEEMARTLYREWFVKFRFPGHEEVPLVDSPLGPIPKGWEVKRIADMCESVSYGFTESASREEVGPKFLRITDIVPEIIDWDNVPYCEMSDNNVTKYLLLPGDIVVARTGATTGYAKRINKRHPTAVFASYLVRLRTKPGVSNRMLGLLMESVDYKQFIKANIGGAAQPQANAVVLSSMPLVPPPPTVAQKFDDMVEPFLDEMEVLAERAEIFAVRATCYCRGCFLVRFS
jgi:type I restriction enzyme, S subunit